MCSRCRKNQLVGVAGAHYHIWHCVYCQSSDVSGLYVETCDFFD
jgi:ribosomal protein L37AE/L43A